MTPPAIWTTTTLGEIRVNRSTRAVPSKHPLKMYELWSVPGFADRQPEMLRGADIGSDKQTVVPGTVLVCKINPRINRIWIVAPHRDAEQIASTEWIPFFPVPELDQKYLAYYLQQDAFRTHLASNVSGVGGSLMRVRPSVVDEFALVLAPLMEQRRIVAAIDEYLSGLDAAAAGLRRILNLLGRYRATVLAAAFAGTLLRVERDATDGQTSPIESGENLLDSILRERKRSDARLVGDRSFPRGWAVTELGAIADVGTGATPLRSNPAYWDHGAVPWVTSGQLNDAVVDRAEQFVSERALAETNLTVYPAGTLLIAMYGEGRTRGKSAELRIPATTNQAIAAIQLSGAAAEMRPWVSIVLAAQYEGLRRVASGGVQPNLNLSMVRAIRIPIPSLAEQYAIVAETSRRLSLAEAISATVQSSLARAARLRQSILQHAFEGKLVPQGPDDEPASVLLDRIRASRAKVSARPKKSRRSA